MEDFNPAFAASRGPMPLSVRECLTFPLARPRVRRINTLMYTVVLISKTRVALFHSLAFSYFLIPCCRSYNRSVDLARTKQFDLKNSFHGNEIMEFFFSFEL